MPLDLPLYRRRRGWRYWLRLLLAAVLLGSLFGVAAIATNANGAGTKFEHLVARIENAIWPPPDR